MATRKVLAAAGHGARAVRTKSAQQFIQAASEPADVLVLGCGIAGCTTALRAARQGLKVTMLTATEDPHDCNSYWAQGGIIYRAEDDTPELLSSDVISAGAGRCTEDAVAMLARDGPRRVEEILIDDVQVPFDRDGEDNLLRCLEASHNRARIIHFKDQTGAAITESMLSATTKAENVTLVQSATAVDLLRHDGHCVGAVVIDNVTGERHLIPSRVTVMATGGLGDIYAHTSNPDTARGDGYAMAQRAGVDLQNMEFVQFHPTTLYFPGERRFLLTEALRGVGARLRDRSGRAFAKEYHPAGELACRDIVSRMITAEMGKQNEPCMYLDCSHHDADYLYQRFPAISEHCKARGLDIAKDLLPVVPAAHFHCGGVKTDLDGQTSLKGLYAAGEVACTGLHGANRLASTSLLEGLVWGSAIVEHLTEEERMENMKQGGCVLSGANEAFETMEKLRPKEADNAQWAVEDVKDTYKQVQTIMWEKVGVERTPDHLVSAVTELKEIATGVEAKYMNHRVTPEGVGLRNASLVASLVAESALANPASVGTHYMKEELTAASA
eukprot:TRINITY_DN7043_c0_g2_i1.p1 TRINITY_DN7043_c0_g2~~TRINITY_DN7043_c0_g2_i1.p1  ORF type:complete len:556 (+),score=232.52 TRINITY_DN7043_c0_g2_i1:53-1720(+)